MLKYDERLLPEEQDYEPSDDFYVVAARYQAQKEHQKILDDFIAYNKRKLNALRNSDDFSALMELPFAEHRLSILYARTVRLHALWLGNQIFLMNRIANLPSAELRALMIYRYIEEMPWAEISQILGLEYRWMFRLHKRALALIEADILEEREAHPRA